MKEYNIRLISYHDIVKSTITLTSIKLHLAKDYRILEETRTYLKGQEGFTLISNMCSIWSPDLCSQRKYNCNE